MARALQLARARLPGVLAPASRVVVAFSGGQDSTCLLHAVGHLRDGPEEVVAAHVDHGLRADSAESAAQAARLAQDMGVECVVRRVDVGAQRHQRSLQDAAREARYAALREVVAEQHATALLVAHSADDQAETLLLHLLRGSGLTGLAAMRVDQTIDGVRVARPLLRVERATTLAYCAVFGLSVVEDASNLSRLYTRNRVRLDLLPALERFNPAIRGVLARTADLLAEDADALDGVVATLHAALAERTGPATFRYQLDAWRAQPRALQRRLLRHAVSQLAGGLANVRASPVEDALELIRSGHRGQTYHLPNGIEIRIGESSFQISRSNNGERNSPRV